METRKRDVRVGEGATRRVGDDSIAMDATRAGPTASGTGRAYVYSNFFSNNYFGFLFGHRNGQVPGYAP